MRVNLRRRGHTVLVVCYTYNIALIMELLPFVRMVFKGFILPSVYACVSVGGYVHAHEVSFPRRSEEGIESPGVKVTDGCRSWKLKSSPLQKQYMLTEPSL